VVSRPIRLAYQPPANTIFLSKRISHQQPTSRTFLLEQISIGHQLSGFSSGPQRCWPAAIYASWNPNHNAVSIEAFPLAVAVSGPAALFWLWFCFFSRPPLPSSHLCPNNELQASKDCRPASAGTLLPFLPSNSYHLQFLSIFILFA
jgi:hypothetical protein